MHTSTADQAHELIRSTGARVTRQRVVVLEFLLHQSASLTHQEILTHLADEALDPVTLYRVLEWLTEHELVHRVAGAGQVWRFSAGGGHHAHEHAHFQCNKCDVVTCVTDVALPQQMRLPPGFQAQEVDLLIKGICPNCVKPQ